MRIKLYPNWTWDTREQFKQHFQLWLRFYRDNNHGHSPLALLRTAYRQARTGYYPRDTAV